MRRLRAERNPSEEIAPERALAFYGGYALMAVGLLLFLSVFFMDFNTRPDTTIRPDPFSLPQEERMRLYDPNAWMEESRIRAQKTRDQGRSAAVRAVLGMVLVGVGAVLNGIGRQGIAGAGFSPSPTATRRDLEPWARAEGELLGTRLEAAGVLRGSPTSTGVEVKVRCLHCGALNDETDRFCGSCGKPLAPVPAG